MKKIVVLGGGPGGLVAAYNLARLLRGKAEITLIDKTGYHLFPPSLLWVMVGQREPEDIMRPLSKLEKHGIKVVTASVESIDPDNNKVATSGGEFEYDYLVVSLGSTPRPELMKADDTVCSPWTVEGALDCRRKLAGFKSGRIIVGAWSWPYKCPPAPFETAFLVKYLLEQRGGDAQVTVVHFWKKPMEPFGPTMAEAFQSFLDMYGVGFKGGVEPMEARGGRLVASSGEEIEYDLAVFAPPHEPPKPVAESPLGDESLGGYMRVDKRTLRSPRYGNVFGVGDIIAPSLGLGMAGIFAHFQAEYVASQIADEILGTYMGEHYNMSGVCVMDLGYAGAAVYCDFSKKVMGEAEYPDCVILGGMRAFRPLKYAFERYWLEKWFT
ncbi:putative dehydrogenase [Aeropyrum pernix K1]|uniref:Dehydrogenase n=1 Tax=Aeropyrum pernix (strain ATCC 700893 / DSM 11879 / JCM 9820 / NBRC 100138 / K1) TaxID=272557 RepID=Q9YD69_AERPE|nr:FAD/NAD(P)-binding oxidoreductase [Aeropyrum pernix]BAA80028.2 putative dehydrogenase [Aeropyrum pernix K1]